MATTVFLSSLKCSIDSVISSGTSLELSSHATDTNPAPARKAARPAIAAAPDFPGAPPISRTWPYMPLLESCLRGLKRAAKSWASESARSDLKVVLRDADVSDDGLSPTFSTPAPITRSVFNAANVTVMSARTCRADGISTATFFALGKSSLMERINSE